MLRIFTDGSCIHNGRKDARASYAVVYPDTLAQSWAAPLEASVSQTNQTAELTAIYEGLRHGCTLLGDTSETTVHLYTDSEYSINCLTKWVAGWKRRGWKTADGKPVVHRELIEHIQEQLKRYNKHVFTHVKAHTGNLDEASRWNQLADDLARKAVETQQRVTHDLLDVKIVRSPDQTVQVLPGIPLALMGPPVLEDKLTAALLANPGCLDQAALRTALITALKKTLTAKSYQLEKSKHNKQWHYRLIEESHLTVQRLDTATDE
jgi:ribonuclease HI